MQIKSYVWNVPVKFADRDGLAAISLSTGKSESRGTMNLGELVAGFCEAGVFFRPPGSQILAFVGRGSPDPARVPDRRSPSTGVCSDGRIPYDPTAHWRAGDLRSATPAGSGDPRRTGGAGCRRAAGVKNPGYKFTSLSSRSPIGSESPRACTCWAVSSS